MCTINVGKSSFMNKVTRTGVRGSSTVYIQEVTLCGSPRLQVPCWQVMDAPGFGPFSGGQECHWDAIYSWFTWVTFMKYKRVPIKHNCIVLRLFQPSSLYNSHARIGGNEHHHVAAEMELALPWMARCVITSLTPTQAQSLNVHSQMCASPVSWRKSVEQMWTPTIYVHSP